MAGMAITKTQAKARKHGSSKLPKVRRAQLSAKVGQIKLKQDCQRLVVVVNRKAKTEVKAGQHLKEVPVRTASRQKLMGFPIVRRNKKIQKVMHMANACSDTSIAMQVVSSAAGPLSDATCIYEERVIGVLHRPQSFLYSRAKDVKGVTVWNVMSHTSESVVLQTDFSKDELVAASVDLKNDIGVVTASVSQLLAKRSHDVIAVNTHPGHHAGPSRVAGFCFLNHIVLAAGLIKKDKPHWKLGVIDIDVHPGDGTQQFVQLYPNMIDKYVSIHSSAKFHNMGAILGANGIALKLDNKKRVAAHRLVNKIDEVLTSWDGACLHIILVSLGFDTLKNDRTAQCGFQMLPAHFRDVGCAFAKRREQVLFVQEGGYNLSETADAFECLIHGFREGRKQHSR